MNATDSQQTAEGSRWHSSDRLLFPLPSGEGQGGASGATAHPRPGFTLVELMMVLIIIGMLVSLLGVAIGFALNKAKQTVVAVEIGNLDVAMQSYKVQYGGEFPPCMGIVNSTYAEVPSRKELFNRAMRKRFPRFTTDYDTLVSQVLPGPNNPATPWQVVSLGTGKTVKLDLQQLDAAEALVFWLAGPPTPAGQGTTVMYGFSSNKTNPFAIGGSRETALYSFDETRLTDIDGDGWPEYVPKGTVTKTIGMAPYVYFDSASYTYLLNNSVQACVTYPFITNPPFIPKNPWGPQNPPTLPIPSGAQPITGLTLVEQFGFATPYLTTCTATTLGTPPLNSTYTFWNPKTFQIIAPGPDSEYGGSISDTAMAQAGFNGGRPYIPLIPQRANQSAAGGALLILQGDQDNQANFIDGKLEDYVPQ